MKIAICFHGISIGKSEKGFETTFEGLCLESVKENIIQYNNCEYDIYFHTWNEQNIKKVIDDYNPKNYIIEDRISFEDEKYNNRYDLSVLEAQEQSIKKSTVVHCLKSRFYSLKKSINVIKNINDYDYIILTRFDLIFKTPLELKLKKNILYNYKFSSQDTVNETIRSRIDGVTGYWPNSIFNYGVMDFIFIGTPKVILKFSNLYNNIDKYLNDKELIRTKWPVILSGHSICKFHINKENIKNISLNKYDEKDIVLYRNDDVNWKIGSDLVDKNDFKNAIKYLYLSKYNQVVVYIKLGLCYYGMKKYDKALWIFKKGLTYGHHFKSYKNIAAIYYERKDYENTLFYLEKAREIYNKDESVEKLYKLLKNRN